MTYDDDELAEAALFLARHDGTRRMPAALEEKLRARGEAFASEVRFTTTKAASVAFETEPEPIAMRRASSRGWLGWLAAAACVALAVYGWRVNVVERRAASRRAPTIVVSEGVRWSSSAHSGEIVIGTLPANTPGEHYRVWLSSSSVAEARPAGSFVCSDECRGSTFKTTDPTELDGVKSVWITRNAESDAWDSVGRGKVVTEGHGGTP